MPHRSGIAARRLRTRLQLDGCCAGGRPKTALRRTDPDGMAETRFCTPRSLRKRPSCLKSGARFPVGAVWHPAFAQVEGPPVRARDFRARKIKHKGRFRSERGRKMRLPRKAVGDVYLGAVFAEGGGRDGRRRGFRTTSRRDRPSRTSASRPRLAVFRHSAIHVCRDRLQYGRVCRDRLQCDTCLPGLATVREGLPGSATVRMDLLTFATVRTDLLRFVTVQGKFRHCGQSRQIVPHCGESQQTAPERRSFQATPTHTLGIRPHFHTRYG